jgi:p70 ribosomal S6 kinase
VQAADWWSVGVLLFEMLTGSAPFRAKNRAVLQKKILTEKIKYPPFLTSAAHKLLVGLLQRDEARARGPAHAARARRLGAPQAS